MERPRPREMLTSEAASTMLILNGWRLLIGADRHRTKELRIEAQPCFRLAGITVGLELAAEFEAIGRQFDKEADDLSARKQAIATTCVIPALTASNRLHIACHNL